MLNAVHFISGLPRSGSTLLAALLRQNPRFQTDITGPVSSLVGAMHHTIGGTNEFSALFDTTRCAQMLRGVFDSYYAHVSEGSVVFDTNRTWTSRVALLGTLYPRCKIICCVREIGWIIDSLERMRVKNPLKLSKLFNLRTGDSVYTRVDALMHSETGLIGAAWSMLREAWFSESAKQLIIVPYVALAREPENTLRALYREIEEPYFVHDFLNVSYDAPVYDNNLGMPGLHTVKKQVEYRERQPTIPPELFSKYGQTHFWESPALNMRNVTVL